MVRHHLGGGRGVVRGRRGGRTADDRHAARRGDRPRGDGGARGDPGQRGGGRDRDRDGAPPPARSVVRGGAERSRAYVAVAGRGGEVDFDTPKGIEDILSVVNSAVDVYRSSRRNFRVVKAKHRGGFHNHGGKRPGGRWDLHRSPQQSKGGAFSKNYKGSSAPGVTKTEPRDRLLGRGREGRKRGRSLRTMTSWGTGGTASRGRGITRTGTSYMKPTLAIL